jgi:hypothetical protein
MRMMTVALAFGAAVAMCSAGTFANPAQARVIRHRPLIRVPVVTPAPYWDSYIVPRYRYRPEDDRVDPNGPPVVPVIRYGNQEVYLPVWNYWNW